MTGVTVEENPQQRRRRGPKEDAKPKQPSLNDNPAVMKEFEEYAQLLTYKHEKYERIVKISRDITIASKKIIFATHALLRSNNQEEDIKKILESFKLIQNTNFKAIAKELRNEDHYQYIKAYTWGIQEYIEALTFFRYVTSGNFCNYDEVVKSLLFTEPKVTNEETEELPNAEEPLPLLIPKMDYLLGLHDLTGEMMRQCINSFAAHRPDIGNNTCDFVRRLYAAMLMLIRVPFSNEHEKKLTVTRQSLEKMEYSCYNAHVRGSESLPFQGDTDDRPDIFS